MIANGHTHRLRGSNRDGGGTLAEAPGSEELIDRRKERQRLPKGFTDRRNNRGRY